MACGSHKTSAENRATAASSVSAAPPGAAPVSLSAQTEKEDPESYTNVIIHNVIIHTKNRLRMKVKWMRACMYPIKPGLVASFDDLDSFRLEISEGLMGMNVSDLATLLKAGVLQNSPLRNLRIQPEASQLKITGTLNKVIPIPVQLLADVSATPDHKQIRLHTAKVSFLKVPFKKLLSVLQLHTSDFFSDKHLDGITVAGDNTDIDINRLMPAPRVRGNLTDVQLWKTGELMEYYGHPREDAVQVRQWRSFMRMRGGTLGFGKLTMHNTDLLLVDTSQSDWLNFDVLHYQEQLVNGETHITPSAGLQIFIPDINKIPRSKRNREISLQWMKNRNVTPPDLP